MHFATTIFLALSPSFISAWELRSGETRLGGSRSYGCSPLNHEKQEKFRWHPSDGSQGNARCCLYVYKREGCEGDSRGFCRDQKDELDWHFRSYEVDCDGRKTGGAQNPAPYPNGPAPYPNGPAPYPNGPGPYPNYPNNPPPPPFSGPNNGPYPPPGYPSGPAPYDPYRPDPYGPQQPYRDCRSGGRCFVNKAADAQSAEGAPSNKEE